MLGSNRLNCESILGMLAAFLIWLDLIEDLFLHEGLRLGVEGLCLRLQAFLRVEWAVLSLGRLGALVLRTRFRLTAVLVVEVVAFAEAGLVRTLLRIALVALLLGVRSLEVLLCLEALALRSLVSITLCGDTTIVSLATLVALVTFAVHDKFEVVGSFL